MQKLFLFLALFSLPAFAVTPGEQAPDFTVKASDGKEVHLADYKGKLVVLEWLNYGCPFVKKHYQSHNMQNLQKEYTGKGVVWLSVISSAPGKQGFSTAKEAESERKAHDSHATAVLLDRKGKIGKLYGAQSTPHMFVINTDGKLAYAGAIDNKPSTDVGDVQGAKNYVHDALEELRANKPVTTAQTKSYGCGVKY